MNRKIAMSAISIMSALTIMGGATFALFSSAASNDGNTLAAGTMTLTINGVAVSGSSPLFTESPAAPGDEFDAHMDLHNNGDVAASVVKVSGIDVNSDPGGLASVLTLQIGTDTDDNGVIDVVLGNAHLNDPSWTNFVLPGVTLSAASTQHLAARLIFDSGAGNAYQGDSINFDINLEASQ